MVWRVAAKVVGRGGFDGGLWRVWRVSAIVLRENWSDEEPRNASRPSIPCTTTLHRGVCDGPFVGQNGSCRWMVWRVVPYLSITRRMVPDCPLRPARARKPARTPVPARAIPASGRPLVPASKAHPYVHSRAGRTLCGQCVTRIAARRGWTGHALYGCASRPATDSRADRQPTSRADQPSRPATDQADAPGATIAMHPQCSLQAAR